MTLFAPPPQWFDSTILRKLHTEINFKVVDLVFIKMSTRWHGCTIEMSFPCYVLFLNPVVIRPTA